MSHGSPLDGFHRRNAVTYLSLTAGIGAMATASSFGPHAAGALIAFAALADTFDGRFARLFDADDAERALGVELDSLADAVTFGAAPVVCLAATTPPGNGWQSVVWWTAAAAYVICAITRLAFYNTSHESVPGFIGLPVPVAALIWSSGLLLEPSLMAGAIVLIGCGAAMVLPLPVPRPTGLALAAFAGWPLVLILRHAIALTDH
jgi:CDP-diacylglycerol---serine O-phosphatidyltransferase